MTGSALPIHLDCSARLLWNWFGGRSPSCLAPSEPGLYQFVGTEYQSLAMLEALACGCAVITRLRGWLFQRVVPGVLITDSQRQASLWLSRLVRNPGLALRIAASAARYVQKQHGLQSICEQWTDLLAELVRR